MQKQVLICTNQPRTRFYTAENSEFQERLKKPVIPFQVYVMTDLKGRSPLPAELVEKIMIVLIDGYLLEGYLELALNLICSCKNLLMRYYRFFDDVPFRSIIARDKSVKIQPAYMKMTCNLSRGFKLMRSIISKMETPLDHFISRDSTGRYEPFEEVKVISLETYGRGSRYNMRIWDVETVEFIHENCELFMPAVRPDGRAYRVAPTNNRFDGLVYYTFTHARAHVYYNVRMIRPLIVLCVAPVNTTIGRTLHEKSWRMLESIIINLYSQNSDCAQPQLRFIDRRDRALDLETYISKTRLPIIPVERFY